MGIRYITKNNRVVAQEWTKEHTVSDPVLLITGILLVGALTGIIAYAAGKQSGLR